MKEQVLDYCVIALIFVAVMVSFTPWAILFYMEPVL